MGKLIIMSTNPLGTPGNEAPITSTNIRDLAATIDIFRTLGGIVALEATTKSHSEKIERLMQSLGGIVALEATTKSQSEKIEQLMQWGSALPYIEKNVAQNTKDLNELGKRHTKELNEVGIRLGREISDLKNKDIGELKNIAHTTKTFAYFAFWVAVSLVSGLGIVILTFLYHRIAPLLK